MKRTTWIATAMIAWCLAGCAKPGSNDLIFQKGASPEPPVVTGPAEMYVTGLFAKTSASGDSWKWTDLTTLCGPQCVFQGIPLPPNVEMKTEQVLRISVYQEHSQGAYDYDLLFGPYWTDEDSAVGTLKNPAAAMQLTVGWIYVTGEWAVAQTDRVSAVAIGTDALLQIDPKNPDIERVFVCDGQLARVEAKRRDNVFEANIPQGQYVRCYKHEGLDTLDPSAPTSSVSPDVDKFYEQVIGMAKEAGLVETTPSPTPSPTPTPSPSPTPTP